MNIIIAQLLLVFACQGVFSRQGGEDDVIWFPIDGLNGAYTSSLGEKYVNQLEGSQYDNNYNYFQSRSQYEQDQNQPDSQYETFQNLPQDQYVKYRNEPRSGFETYTNQQRNSPNTWNAVSPGLTQKEKTFFYIGDDWGRRTKKSPEPQRRSFSNCMSNCATTLEYAPVCGTDRRSYSNRGQLSCAQSCGKNVRILHDGPC